MIFKRLLLLGHAMFLFSVLAVSQKIQIDESNQGLHFKSSGNPLVTYQTATADVPAGVKADFRKSDLSTPSSGQVLTRILHLTITIIMVSGALGPKRPLMEGS